METKRKSGHYAEETWLTISTQNKSIKCLTKEKYYFIYSTGWIVYVQGHSRRGEGIPLPVQGEKKDNKIWKLVFLGRYPHSSYHL